MMKEAIQIKDIKIQTSVLRKLIICWKVKLKPFHISIKKIKKKALGTANIQTPAM